MSMKEKKADSVVESDEENEMGACGNSNDPHRPPMVPPEPIAGIFLDESVDNLSMEVHLGEDNSRHPSEISSISYQNLLEDGEPSNSIISRRGSDDSLDSYPPDFGEAEIPPEDMETFEACDLPLSEHFPMGALQKAEKQNKCPGNGSSHHSESSNNLPHPTVKLKGSSDELDAEVKLRDKTVKNESIPSGRSEEEVAKKRSSLEIRNNIPVVGEVKDYEKDLSLEFAKSQSTKPLMVGLKQSPGVARRVDHDPQSAGDDEKGTESSLGQAQSVNQVRPRNSSEKTKENAIEVITPVPKNLNIENEYDYVKYARVQQGNSYVGMRLAYSSSNDSLNLKQGGGSVDSSREPSPEKILQKKMLSELGEQEKVSEETLTEIPLNNSEYSEDKKAFTLSPENTECDSVEVESVTSEGENSTPGFPTVEDGLSSSQASDADEGASGNNRSPSKMLQLKQKAALDQDLLKDDDEEDVHPKEMDAQAIMDDLKMKREALDMAIADIKSAIQRSKSMSLESPYSSQQETDESQPVWVKRDAAVQLQRRQEEMRRVREEIERQQEELNPSQNKIPQEKEEGLDREEVGRGVSPGGQNEVPGTDDGLQTVDNRKNDKENKDGDVCENTSKDESGGDDGCQETGVNFSAREDYSLSSGSPEKENRRESGSSPELDPGLEATQKRAAGGSEEPENREDVCNVWAPEREILSSERAAASSDAKILKEERTGPHAYVKTSGDTDESLVEQVSGPDSKQAVDVAIAAVSSEIVLNLGGSPFKSTEIQSCDAAEDKDVAAGAVEDTEVDVREFDELLSSPTRAGFVGETLSANEPPPADTNLTEANLTPGGNESSMLQDEVVNSVPLAPSEIPEEEGEGRSVGDDCGHGGPVREESQSESDGAEEYQDALDQEEESQSGRFHDTEDDGDPNELVGKARRDGFPRGYDSDDECEDAEGMRYTRRNKGKKYAPLQKDDSLELGGACGGGRRDSGRSNGHSCPRNSTGPHAASNGSLTNHGGGGETTPPLHHHPEGGGGEGGG
ncbi:reticulocyte binding protein 2 homolog b, partial [Aplysia californica]|uniref:Reticulocyte binding protein 2 homolog b n=1 Tax=Aplysia californica TaxID=6500 RepID=A0ABM0K4H8_APLCA